MKPHARASASLRLAWFSLLFALPSGLVGWAAGGLRLGWCLSASGLGLFLLLAASPDRLIARGLRARRQERDSVLTRSLERALRSVPSHRAPALFVFPEPLPRCMIARGWVGTGSIFLSQGMVSKLTESELRGLFEHEFRELARPDAHLRSFASLLHGWLGVTEPLGNVMVSLLLLPLRRVVQALGRT